MMSMKNIFTNFKFNIDSILKTWFVITIIITITAFSWTINYINEKILIHGGFSKITIYLHYILILSLIILTLKKRKIMIFLFLFFYLFGDFFYRANLNNINNIIISNVKSNTFFLTIINKSKEFFVDTKKIKTIDESLFQLNPKFEHSIILKKDNVPNIYIVSNNFEKKIKPIFKKVKNSQKILPIYIKQVSGSKDREFTYYDRYRFNDEFEFRFKLSIGDHKAK